MYGSTKLRYGVSLAYSVNSFQRSRDIVIHHGLMGSSKNFKSLSKSPSFSKHVNSYLVDARNHGESPHTPTHTIDDLADDLCQFIKQRGVNRPDSLTLMGHSMGGMAVMKFTEKYPEMQEYISRVIIVDMSSSFRIIDKKGADTGSILKRMLEVNLDQPTEAVFSQITAKAGNKDVAGLMKTNIRVVGKNSHAWIPNLKVLAQDYERLAQFELDENDWRRPVDLIYGATSNLLNEQQLKLYCKLYPQMNKNRNFFKVEGAGHWVHFDNPNQFLNITEHVLTKDD